MIKLLRLLVAFTEVSCLLELEGTEDEFSLEDICTHLKIKFVVHYLRCS
uniref:Uncharacterized protein n=1 Tax=Strigamia maritima TaxID=126957 RepID=T1IPM4_STRMM